MFPQNCNSSLQMALNQLYFNLSKLPTTTTDLTEVMAALSALMTNLNDLDHQTSTQNLERTQQIDAAESNLLTAIQAIGISGGGTVDLSAVMAALTDIQANTPTDLSAVITLLNTINAKPSGQATDLTAVMAALTDIQANTPTDLTAVITLLNEINAKPSGGSTVDLKNYLQDTIYPELHAIYNNIALGLKVSGLGGTISYLNGYSIHSFNIPTGGQFTVGSVGGNILRKMIDSYGNIAVAEYSQVVVANQIINIVANYDSSSFNRQIASGTPKFSSVQKNIGNTSLYLNSSPVVFANSTDFNFNGNLTIEWSEFRTGTATCGIIKRDPTTSNQAFLLGYGTGSNSLIYMSSSGGTWDIASGKILSSSSILNEWHKFAVVRNGTTFLSFKDGIQQDSWQSTLSLNIGAGGIDLGGGWPTDATNPYQGYLDELRISNIARYTANFTPQTAPFTPDANTLLLLHGEGGIEQIRYLS